MLWHKEEISKEKKQKVARNHSNVNWQGTRHINVDSVNQAFDANKVEIKHKFLEAIRILRQADRVLEEIRKYINDQTAYV